MDILPFVVDYWKRFVTHATVFDNGSDDGSIEFLNKFDWIDVIHYETGGKIKDSEYLRIKDNSWKESRGKADFVVVCDMDECLFSLNIDSVLKYMKDNGYTIANPPMYRLFGDCVPQYEEGKLLHEISRRWKLNGGADKPILFDPNKIAEINYVHGSHKCSPTGEVKWYNNDGLFTMDIRKGFGVDYYINKMNIMKNRLSEENLRHGWGIHYAFQEDFHRKDYEQGIKESIDFVDYLRNT